jgi:hypothetical protein
MLEDRLDDVGVIVDTELIRNGQEQRVSLGDGFVIMRSTKASHKEAA